MGGVIPSRQVTFFEVPGSATRPSSPRVGRQLSGPVLGAHLPAGEFAPPSKNDQQVEADRSLLQLLAGL